MYALDFYFIIFGTTAKGAIESENNLFKGLIREWRAYLLRSMRAESSCPLWFKKCIRAVTTMVLRHWE